MNELERIKTLRQIISIPIVKAKKLLEKYEGNIQLAEKFWKIRQVNRLMDEGKVSEALSSEILTKNGFDYEKSLREVESQSKDLITKALESSKDLWTVLYPLARVIEERNHLKGYTWESNLNILPGADYKFYLVWEWINYIQLESTTMIASTSPEVISILRDLDLDRYVQMIEDVQNQILTIEQVEFEFTVESPIGEALSRFAKEKMK